VGYSEIACGWGSNKIETVSRGSRKGRKRGRRFQEKKSRFTLKKEPLGGGGTDKKLEGENHLCARVGGGSGNRSLKS